MPRYRFFQLRSLFGFSPLALFAAALTLVWNAPVASPQESPGKTIEGYITAVNPPDSFDINGTHVATQSATLYGQIGGNAPTVDGPLHNALQIGAWVRVVEAAGSTSKSVTAAQVLVRDTQGKKISGLGVIDAVISTGPEPVYRADGYTIRIAAATETKFHDGLKTLADIATNTWLHYEGRREADGSVTATRAEFIPAHRSVMESLLYGENPHPHPVSVPPQQTTGICNGCLIDADGKILPAHTKVRYGDSGGFCGWHRLVADEPLQERVRRVGASVIPAYQKLMQPGDPWKIPFRFYAVNEPKLRYEIACNAGLIVVPRQVVERLANDDQLAAVIAQGVAGNLQLQESRLMLRYRDLLFSTAGFAALIPGAGPPVLLATEVGGGIYSHEEQKTLEEQRGRIALSILADAGYDPWQAPEAWRLLEPKKLPTDTDALKYPSHSGYLLGVLNLQYRPRAASAVPAGASGDSPNQ